MRRYSFDEGPEVNQDSGKWVKYADVQAWLEAWRARCNPEGYAVFVIAELLADLAREDKL